MSGRVTLTVDGRQVEAEAGEILLRVLRRLGIRVPTLCHDDRLTPYGGCRLCVVHRRDSRPGLVPACSTAVQPGMVIVSSSPEIVDSRRRQLQILALNHRLECPVCERHGDCRFQDLLHEIGLPEGRLPFSARRRPRDGSWPVIGRDPDKCVVCGRCVRLCEEVQGVSAIGFVGRGLGVTVATFRDQPLDCEFCGQCVSACPAAALVALPYRSEAPAWLRQRGRTTCSLCSCGCQVVVETFAGRVVRVSGDESLAPNRGKLCAKGWLGWDLLTSPERLTAPLVRRDGRLEEVEWEIALTEAARLLAEAVDGGGALGVVGSARLTNEDAGLLQWLGRAALKTPHVTVGPTAGVAALVDGVRPVLGSARSNADLERLAAADLVLVLRGDPTRTHPLVKTELVQGVIQRRRPLAIAATFFGGLERHAAVTAELEPGTEAVLCRAVCAELLERQPERARALAGIEGFESYREGLADYRRRSVWQLLGRGESAVEPLVALFEASRSPVVVLVCASGLPGDEADAARAAAELALVSGGGVLVLTGSCNLQGVLDAGLHPCLAPGPGDGNRPAALAELSHGRGSVCPSEPGWGPAELAAAAQLGQVAALLLVGEDPVQGWPPGCGGRAMLDGAGAVIVLDPFLSDSARLADVVLPVAMLGERGGTVTGSDGVVRRLDPPLEPPKQLPQDRVVLAELARRLGAQVPELVGPGLGAPVPESCQPRFLSPPPPRPASLAGAGRMLLDPSPQLFHSGAVTARSPLLAALAPAVTLGLHPADAVRLGIGSGDPVAVSDGTRELLFRARLDPTVRRGTVRAPGRGGLDDALALAGTEGVAVRVDLRRPH